MKIAFPRWAGLGTAVALIVAVGMEPPPSFSGQETDLLISPGKLSKAHGAYSGLDNCTKCHTPGTKSVDQKCLACHEELLKRINAGTGFHKDKKTGCLKCHPEHHGPDFELIDWKPKEFDHAQSGYLLIGKHAAVSDCQKCHKARNSPTGKSSGSYLVKSVQCKFCHEDVHKGQFTQDCDQCHALNIAFKELKFDHSRGAFPLKGAHSKVPCEKCHPQKKWRSIPSAGCLSCHRDPHLPSQGTACTKCHSEVSWKTGIYNHDKTRYPLRGKHSALQCKQCHTAGKFEKMPFASCRDCHKKDLHQGQFQGDCSRCHGVSSWNKVELDHLKTRYPLTGKHLKVPCKKCHLAAAERAPVLYRPIKTGCVDCHKDVHFGQFAKGCDQCHSTLGFDPAFLRFDHQVDSSYKLEGTHVKVQCENCHKKTAAPFPGGTGEAVRYRPLPTECVSCHPDFHGHQLGSDCRKCHDLLHFKPAPGFSHEKSSFSLKGFHESIGCEKCHPPVETTVAGKVVNSPRYKPINGKCNDCHHQVDHNRTAYPLTGKHAEADCGGCHNPKTPNTKRLRGTTKAQFKCQNCHAYRHPGKQENCVQCHTTQSWAVDVSGAKFLFRSYGSRLFPTGETGVPRRP